MSGPPVLIEHIDNVCVITLNRPAQRNAVDRPAADALRKAFEDFDNNPALHVAILTGAGGNFCAGADLSALGDPQRRNEIDAQGSGPGPMGPTRLAM
ncbi:MAG: enoyl-CoA hydratase-related protein, partial [Pseudomonadales bacterium]|nr:enoyl-CoA hydratase-related protein [Pseudomonadales bacterium]